LTYSVLACSRFFSLISFVFFAIFRQYIDFAKILRIVNNGGKCYKHIYSSVNTLHNLLLPLLEAVSLQKNICETTAVLVYAGRLAAGRKIY
jgi:hypothetical protein